MTYRSLVAYSLAVSLAALAGCGDETGNSSSDTTSSSSSSSGAGGAGGGSNSACKIEIPTTYESADYDKNAAVENDLRTSFSAFIGAMDAAAADLTLMPTAAELTALYDAGTPNWRSITTTYYAGKTDEWIAAYAAATGKTWTPAEPPMGPGGKFGNYIYTSTGIDIVEVIEKGFLAAANYNHVLTVLKGPLTEASIDQLVSIYGAHPSFPQADKDVPNPDIFLAKYAKRRNPQGEPGLYQTIKTSLITAKAAIAAGSDCDAERDAALATFRDSWEKASFATVIYYLNDAAVKLSTEPATDATLSGGLHGYGEAIGFIHGYRMLPTDARKITDAQIDELLASINAPVEGEATAHKFVTDPAAEIPKLQAAITKIADIYGFTAQEVEGFKVNY